MTKTSLSFLFLFAFSYFLPAQDTLWLDLNWDECPKSEATYFHLETQSGEWRNYVDYYKSNNQIQNTGQYLNDKYEGQFIWYYENGQKSSEINYVNGFKEGIAAEWYSDGTPDTEEVYKKGKRIGKIRVFNREAKIWEEVQEVVSPDNPFARDEDSEDTENLGNGLDSLPRTDAFYEREPIPLNLAEVRRNMDYPLALIEKDIEGKVVVKLLVSQTGMIEKYEILNSTHPDFTKAVLKQLDALRFSPGMIDGQNVKAWVILPFGFKLK